MSLSQAQRGDARLIRVRREAHVLFHKLVHRRGGELAKQE
jgi:hypothetical protein